MDKYIIESGVCWVIFYTAFLLFFRKDKSFVLNRAYLLISVLAGLVIPLLSFRTVLPVIDLGEITPMVGMIFSEQLSTSTWTAIGFSFNQILWLIYLCGVVLFSGRLLIAISQIVILLLRGKVDRIASGYIVKSELVKLPFSFFNLLFVPHGFQMKARDNEKIINHELAHIEGGHSFDVLFLEIISILFWFNPIIHLFKRSLRLTHEYLADASVIEYSSKASYAKLLIQQSYSGPYLVNYFNQSQLKKRLKMMASNTSVKVNTIKYLFAIPALVLCIWMFSNENSFAVDSESPTEKLIGEIDEQPRFPGCEDSDYTVEQKNSCSFEKLIEFIGGKLKYPEVARKNGVEGMVVVSFTVQTNGQLKDIKIVRSLSDDCDKEVLRIVHDMPYWIPGKMDGKPVAAEMKLPVKFKF